MQCDKFAFLIAKKIFTVDFSVAPRYNIRVKKQFSEAFVMKKIIAVFLAVLTVFGTASIAFAADDTAAAETSAAVPEENTTRNIKNDDGLVVPWNFKQLKLSVIFKIFEKIFKFFLNLFGANKDNVDQEGATAIDDAGNWLDELLSEVQSNLNNSNN